jgi:hypothetical protein
MLTWAWNSFFFLAFLILHNASRLRIGCRQYSRLSCRRSVLFWVRRFLEFESGRGEWTLLFHSARSLHVCSVPTLSLAAFLIVRDCLQEEFVTQNWEPPKILRSRHPWSGRPVSKPRFELGTSQIWGRNTSDGREAPSVSLHVCMLLFSNFTDNWNTQTSFTETP